MPIEKIKVLHVIARFNIGGTARYLTYLLPELEEKRLNTLLVVGRVQSGEVEDSSLGNLSFFRIEKLGRRIDLLDDLKSYFKLRKIVKSYKPDLIHTHTFKAGFLGRLMYFKIPKLHTYHGHLLTDPHFSRFQIAVIVRIEKFLSKFTTQLIVTGQQVATDLETKGVSTSAKFLSIPGQTRLSNLIPREIARAKLGLSSEFTVLWVARVVSVKNPKLLLEVAKKMPECEFVMAGDGDELELIRSLAPKNVKILGFVDVREILMAGDVFLSTSLNEGIPYSILEAQSINLPVIAVKAGAVSEIVRDGVNGYLVDPNAEEIVNRLQVLREKPQLIDRMNLISEANSDIPSGISFSDRHIELYRAILAKY